MSYIGFVGPSIKLRSVKQKYENYLKIEINEKILFFLEKNTSKYSHLFRNEIFIFTESKIFNIRNFEKEFNKKFSSDAELIYFLYANSLQSRIKDLIGKFSFSIVDLKRGSPFYIVTKLVILILIMPGRKIYLFFEYLSTMNSSIIGKKLMRIFLNILCFLCN